MEKLQIYSSVIPAGMLPIVKLCGTLYPDQKNPLQVSTVIKYWMGGYEPLDYISIYSNYGNAELGIPPHWHYISLGLSDIYGDNRIHKLDADNACSGYGFELTFRLAKDKTDKPPMWPTQLMQRLAKYIFKFGGNETFLQNGVNFGDNLAGVIETKLKCIISTADLQLGTMDTPHGRVRFLQLVALYQDELDALRKCSRQRVSNFFATTPGIAGTWPVTDVSRTKSFFDSAELEAARRNPPVVCLSDSDSDQVLPCYYHWFDRLITGKFIIFSDERMYFYFETDGANLVDNNFQQHLHGNCIAANTITLKRLHLIIDEETGYLLARIFECFLKHGKRFTLQNKLGRVNNIIFVPPTCAKVAAAAAAAAAAADDLVNVDTPFLLSSTELRIWISERFIRIVENSSATINNELPKTFHCADENLFISVVPSSVFTKSWSLNI